MVMYYESPNLNLTIQVPLLLVSLNHGFSVVIMAPSDLELRLLRADRREPGAALHSNF